MSGRRLLDAAKLAAAARAVASHHARLRRDQWRIYTRTSSLARAVAAQTDRVTVTLGAARQLLKRFAEDGRREWEEDGVVRGQQQQQQQSNQPQQAQRQAQQSAQHQAPQNHQQTASFASTPQPPSSLNADPQFSSSLNPDEACSSSSSVSASFSPTAASSLHRRALQRRAEAHLPTASAAAIPAEALSPGTAGNDSFASRGTEVDDPLSSLPRVKLPRSPGGVVPEVGAGLLGREVNADVFPAPDLGGQAGARNASIGGDGDGDVDVQGEAIGEGNLPGLRVARMLASAGGAPQNAYVGRRRAQPVPLPEMRRAEERWAREREHEGAETVKESVGDGGAVGRSAEGQRGTIAAAGTEDAETQRLAASIAQDAQSQSAAAVDAPAEKQYEMRESRVPSSRFGRLWQYGGLATSMAFGAVGEGFRRFAGGGKEGSVMLSESNINRLVAKLSRMRGAALKLGQMMSFQDSNFLPPTINAVLQRVQDSADYMPASQRDKVLVRNLGQDWRDRFSHFEEKPFAAASIGQVHKAVLRSNGKDVALKIQYPGVRNSIDSDLNNLSLLLTASQLLPRGLYLDKTIANARTELAWECDYEREAKAGMRFKDELLADERDIFTVPTVYAEASGPDVLTAEFMHGTAVTKINDLTQEERDWIGTQILRISWRELMEWRFMQTDPNWTNFLYNRSTKKIELLDFGASRDFPDKFVVPYVELLIAASRGDRNACRDRSIELGYLTGHESTSMLNAHVDSIMVLAEPFTTSAPDVYSFENQTITDRVRANIGLMLRERLAPPPEETYSLHRKLSGAFLLCARLRSRVRTKEMFARAVDVWNGRTEKVGNPK